MKRMIKYALTIICLLLSLVFVFVSVQTTASISVIADEYSEGKSAFPVVIIDAGHGGEDGGAVSERGLVEKDVNLSIALYLQKLFILGGFEVVMTRTEDTALYDSTAETLREKKVSDIHNRSEICNSNENNIFISIHQNKFEQSKYSGAQVFYSAGSDDSKALAENIRIVIKELLQNNNERTIKPSTSDIYILDNAQVPCVLVECGFLSNFEEELLLRSDYYRQSLAYCIYLGFLEYYYSNY